MTSTVGTTNHNGAGPLLRRWRHTRRLSQLDLANGADVSARHLSYVETGRASPSRQLLLRLCEHLDVPLRDRNQLLLAAGYAPVYADVDPTAPVLAPIRAAVRRLLDGHHPYPALAVDGEWRLVDGNAAVALFTDGAADDLLAPPVNVLRLSLHPDGVARRIVNIDQWRAHVFARLRRQIDATGSPTLADLLTELESYPGGDAPEPAPAAEDVVVPLQLRVGDAVASFVSTTTVFGTPLSVTVAELAIESFFPADDATADLLRAWSATDDKASSPEATLR